MVVYGHQMHLTNGVSLPLDHDPFRSSLRASSLNRSADGAHIPYKGTAQSAEADFAGAARHPQPGVSTPGSLAGFALARAPIRYRLLVAHYPCSNQRARREKGA